MIVIEETTMKLLASVAPNLTADTLTNPVPVIVTVVPPASGPPTGTTLVTVGAAW